MATNGVRLRLYLLAPTLLERQALHALFREHLTREIELASGFAPVEIWAAMRSAPDLALVSTDRATPEARDAVQMIPRLRRQTRVVVLGTEVDHAALQAWRDCNLSGYVVKDGGLVELQKAIASIESGSSFFSVEAFDAIHAAAPADARRALSRREAELLPLLARGLTLREAADRMTVSYKTADTYRTSLLRKLGVRDRIELVRYAIRERIVEP